MGKTVLITGGTGSFGQAFTRHLLGTDVGKVIVFSRDELKQSGMKKEIVDPRMRYFIGNVRDLERLKEAFRTVDIVVHAAAMKQIPACEYNPEEAVKTNVDGARNVIQAALDTPVEKVVALSTDKAVAPCNIYGKTKALAESLFVGANVYRGLRNHPLFSMVRYGNVVGSRGSVIPLFKEQARTGRLTITDDRMTRFWMTLNQAVRLVEHALQDMMGAEIYVPIDLPALPIIALARMIAPDAYLVPTGIRPGEKVHESLLSEQEIAQVYLGNRSYKILSPDHPKADPALLVHPDFRYCSQSARRPCQAEVDEWLK